MGNDCRSCLGGLNWWFYLYWVNTYFYFFYWIIKIFSFRLPFTLREFKVFFWVPIVDSVGRVFLSQPQIYWRQNKKRSLLRKAKRGRQRSKTGWKWGFSVQKIWQAKRVLEPCFGVPCPPPKEMTFFEFHEDQEWQDHPPAHSKCHQKIGGRFGVEACHIVRPGDSKNDQEMRNLVSEKSAKKYFKQGFWSLKEKYVSTL